MYQKVRCRCKVIVLLTKSTAFLMLSLHLKLIYSVCFLSDGGGGEVVLFNNNNNNNNNNE